MLDSVPQDWKTDNLFVLIGGNPMPNYVAAQLLLAPEGHLHLIYSKDVKEVANKLTGYFPDRHVLHELQDPTDSAEILKVVTEALQKHCKPGTVGLHYTGGTKAMSVHAHRAISKQRNNAILTYLDARTLSLRRDDQSQKIGIQYGTKPTVADLFNLHDIALQKALPQEAPQPLFPELEKALAIVHSKTEGRLAYEQWCDHYLRSNGRLIETSKELAEGLIPYPVEPVLAKVANAMRVAFATDGEAFQPDEVVSKLKKKELARTKHLIKYLDGTWLEQWVLAAFLANQQTHRLHSFAVGIETHQQEARLRFEFDVAAMQGYQLYAVSCTRSGEKSLCKSKLFEAFTRATQMGGDEARVALVCAVSAPAVLQEQVAEVWRTNRNRMRVFGADDLPYLPARFVKWLDS